MIGISSPITESDLKFLSYLNRPIYLPLHHDRDTFIQGEGEPGAGANIPQDQAGSFCG